MTKPLPTAPRVILLLLPALLLFSCTQNRMQLEEQTARRNQARKGKGDNDVYAQYSDSDGWDEAEGMTEEEEMLAHTDDSEKNMFYDMPGEKDSNLMLEQLGMPSEEVMEQGLAAMNLEDEVNEQLMTDDMLAAITQVELSQQMTAAAQPQRMTTAGR